MTKVTRLSTLSIVAALAIAGLYAKPAWSQSSYPRTLDSQALVDPIRFGITKSSSLFEVEGALTDKFHLAVSSGDLNAQAQLTNDIGLVDLLEGKTEESSQFISRSLLLREQLYGVNSNPCADCLNGLAAVALAKADYAGAEHSLASASLIEEKSAAVNGLRIADTLDLKARLLLAQGKFREAEEPARTAQQLRTRLLGATSPVVAESVLVSALFQLQKGNAEAATAAFVDSLNSFDSKLVAPQSLMALSLLQLDRGELSASTELYKKSLVAQTSLLGANNPEIAAYKGLYLRQLWKHHNFLTALALKNELGVRAQQANAADAETGILQTSFLTAASSGLTSKYQPVHIVFCVLVAVAALLLIAIMVAARDLVLPLPKGDGFNDFVKHNNTLSGSGALNQALGSRQRQAVKNGKLPLMADLDYIPNWDKVEVEQEH